ncbi:MAG: hypothetical protein MMC33_001179 [Icmadophila ericetorum]|nr:hypothetical protein [Icmadophila ericetorum]
MCRGYKELFKCCGSEKTIGLDYCGKSFQELVTGERKTCGPEPTENDRIAYSDPPYLGTWSCDACKGDEKLKEPWAVFREASITYKKSRQAGALERKDNQAKAISAMEARDKAMIDEREAEQAERDAKANYLVRQPSRREEKRRASRGLVHGILQHCEPELDQRSGRSTAGYSTEQRRPQSSRQKSVGFSDQPPAFIEPSPQVWPESRPRVVQIPPRSSAAPRNVAMESKSIVSGDRSDRELVEKRSADLMQQEQNSSRSRATNTVKHESTRLMACNSSRPMEQKTDTRSSEHKRVQSSNPYGSIMESRQNLSSNQHASVREQKPIQSTERRPSIDSHERMSSDARDHSSTYRTEIKSSRPRERQRKQLVEQTPMLAGRAPKIVQTPTFVERVLRTVPPSDREQLESRSTQPRRVSTTTGQKLELGKPRGTHTTHATVRKSSASSRLTPSRNPIEQARQQLIEQRAQY